MKIYLWEDFNFKLFFKFFGSIIIILCLIYSLFLYNKYNYIVSQTDKISQLKLNLKSKILTKTLENIEMDLEFMVEYVESKIKDKSLDETEDLENFLWTFLKNHKHFQQLRYLSVDGKELVRVDYLNAKASIKRDLQDKSARDYYLQSKELKEKEIYVSALDLNVEYGEVETPYKPMLRFSSPIFVEGEKKGYIVINYNAKELLQNIEKKDSDSHLAILNKASYYLIGFEKSKEFGFMFNKPQHTFKRDYPDAWRDILQGKTKLNFGDKTAHYFKYNPIKIINPNRRVKGDKEWYLVSYYFNKDIYNKLKEKFLADLLQYLPLLFMMGILSYVLSIYMVRNKRAEKDLIKSKEEALNASKAKSEFLANMSHEIRTPLNAIIGLTNLTLQTKLTDTQKNYLTKSVTSSNMLLHIINDILDYSKIEADKIDLETIAFDVEEIFQQTSSLFAHKAQRKGIKLSFDASKISDSIVVGDPFRITQVLINLVANSIKFTHEGFVEVSATLEDIDGVKAELKFSVKDSGIGISKEKQQRLFNDFTQADTSNTREYGGTGLGLAISLKLSRLMGGDISLESADGKGSTFSFSAVVEYAKAEDKMKSKSKKDKKNMLVDGRVLLVEDNEINQLVAKQNLLNLGLEVVTASNGQKAVQKVKEESFDIVFMDLQMPVMDGYKATKMIREFNSSVPIIALSAAVMKEDLKMTKEAGMDGHLAKPIDIEKLKEVLMEYLDVHFKEVKKERVELHQEIADGIDLNELFRRISNKELAYKMLVDFSKREEFKSIDSLDVESVEFKSTIHNIKGLSANLSLVDVFKYSSKIESSSNSDGKKEFLVKLQKSLNDVCRVINEKIAPKIKHQKSESKLSKDELVKTLTLLKEDISAGVFITQDRVNFVLNEVRYIQTEKITKQLEKQLENFEYAKASLLLEEIIENILL